MMFKFIVSSFLREERSFAGQEGRGESRATSDLFPSPIILSQVEGDENVSVDLFRSGPQEHIISVVVKNCSTT